MNCHKEKFVFITSSTVNNVIIVIMSKHLRKGVNR